MCPALGNDAVTKPVLLNASTINDIASKACTTNNDEAKLIINPIAEQSSPNENTCFTGSTIRIPGTVAIITVLSRLAKRLPKCDTVSIFTLGYLLINDINHIRARHS